MATKKALSVQSKEIVKKVYHQMKYEAGRGRVMKLTDARWRTSQAVGVSESTITRILREERLANKSGRPDKVFQDPVKRKRVRPKCNLEDFDLGVLRRTIMSFHADFKETPRLRRLREVLADRIGFRGCIQSMRTILKEVGYEWSDVGEGRKILVERHDVQMWRFKYLKQLKQYRDEGRHIVYTDETYVNINTHKHKGLRIIIVHAGGPEGFIPNAALVFKGESKSNDYHDDVTFENYKAWLTEKLLPNLPDNSVLITDNAPYHIVEFEKSPNPESNRKDIQTWLTEKHIPFEESLTTLELYDLILKNKDKFKNYEIDKLVRSKGFEILRLPAHHPELNPLKKIWGVLKENVSKKNNEMDITSNIELLKEELGNIDMTSWADMFRVVEHIEKQYAQYFDLDNEFIIYFNDALPNGME